MAHKLTPELQEKYNQIMRTSTKKDAASPKTQETPPTQKASTPFLSSMPIRPVKNLSVKAFTFTGKKKIVEKESKAATPSTHASTTTTVTKPKASGKLVVLVIIGLVIVWTFFWMIILDLV